MDAYEGIEFGLSAIAYMNYVKRKSKRDNSFEPHPLIKAFICAFDDLEKIKIGETQMGVSGDANKYPDDSPKESYCVVIRKERHGIRLLKVHDLTIGKDVPTGAAIYLLLVSMKMDKIDGPDISLIEAVSIINETLPEINVVLFDNANWKEARDNFKKILQEDKFKIFKDIYTEEVRQEYLSIKYNTPWEEYPSRVRSTIATTWLMTKDERKQAGKDNIIFTSIDKEIQKYKIMQFVRELLFGRTSEYFERNKPDASSEFTYKEQEANNNSKIGRNKPCPCGKINSVSGKPMKYKNCCGKNK